MQLFDWDRKLKGLEEAVKKDPSPLNYTNLIKYLQSKGNLERAKQIAAKAVDEFPDSEDLFLIYYPFLKSQYHDELKQLKKIIKTNPSVEAYSQIAEIYKALREDDEALFYCREAIKKFPHDDHSYVIIGELRLNRFYKDLLARDGEIAWENLEKAFEINPKNYRALLALAKFYLQIGAITKANQRLRDILTFAPEDENIQTLIEIAVNIEKPEHEDIDFLLQNVEEQEDLYYTLDGVRPVQAGPEITPEIFEKPLDALKNVDEVSCFLVCDNEGNLIAHHAKENVDYNILYEVATCIYQTVATSSKKMDIGKFQHNQIDGAFGCIHILVWHSVVFFMFGSGAVAYKELQKFMSEVASSYPRASQQV